MMVSSHTDEIPTGTESNYDRMKELKAFDDTKAGVKGLVDSGIEKLPRIFIQPSEDHDKSDSKKASNIISIPVIDLDGFEKNKVKRQKIIKEIRNASETWGFFKIVNHGVPISIMDDMIQSVLKFHDLPKEVRAQFYTRDFRSKSSYVSNFDLYQTTAASWRDTYSCVMAPDPPSSEELPDVLRGVVMEYSRHIGRLGSVIFELIAEGLGLRPNYLKEMHCDKGQTLICNYYPPCPQPELTMGTTKHSDADFLTILVEDQIGGLQVLHDNEWVDVPPVNGSLTVNIGDLLQLISNDQLKSVEHRALANRVGPRVSVASFFITYLEEAPRLYGPIKELLSETKLPMYRETTANNFVAYCAVKGLDGNSALTYFKL